VRRNGRIYEALKARIERRPACDLYHSALEIRVPEATFTAREALRHSKWDVSLIGG
jgi:hypothetical protein